jgi:hypothetical protein
MTESELCLYLIFCPAAFRHHAMEKDHENRRLSCRLSDEGQRTSPVGWEQYVIRPDGHIGIVDPKGDTKKLSSYLDTWISDDLRVPRTLQS